MKEPIVIQGYTIIERFPVGEQGFAIGENLSAPAPYVTWQYRTADADHFFWGHYVSSKQAAYEDYEKRIEHEISDLSERTGKSPMLPPQCLTVEMSTGDLICIKRGISGQYLSDWNEPGDSWHNCHTADTVNRRWGVTKAQEEAMLAGSMFGWDCPAADPHNYSHEGEPRRIKKHDDMER